MDWPVWLGLLHEAKRMQRENERLRAALGEIAKASPNWRKLYAAAAAREALTNEGGK